MFYSENDPLLVFIDLLMVIVLFRIYRPLLFKNNAISDKSVYASVVLAGLFCVFSFWGSDWFHYYDDFIYGNVEYTEEVYAEIASYLTNYLGFRLAVWGVALLLVVRVFKIVSIDFKTTFGIFCISSLIWFSYGRVSLAMALIFYGLAVYSKENSSFLVKILGIALLASAYYFHKSSGFGIATAALAIVCSKLSPKKSLWLILLLFPVLLAALRMNLLDAMDSLTSREDSLGEYMAAGQINMEGGSSKGVALTTAFFLQILEKIPYYIAAYIGIKLLTNRSEHNLHNCVLIPSFYCVLIVIFSSLFFFDIGVNTTVIYTRFLRFSILPMVIPIAFCMNKGIYTRETKYFLYSATASMLLQVFYSFYCKI